MSPPPSAQAAGSEAVVVANNPVTPGSESDGVAGAADHWAWLIPDLTDLVSHAAPWVVVAYLVGVLGFLVRLSAALAGGHRLRSRANPITDSRLLRLISEQADRVMLKTVPVVAYCDRVAVPTVVGVLRPMVLLPASLMTGLAPGDLAAIVRHEFAHIRRCDLWMNLIQRIVESLLFFHPAVWMISRRLSSERELCCDDLVVSSGCEPMGYAGALLRMAENCAGAKHSDSMGLAASGESPNQLENRVVRLLSRVDTPHLHLTRGGMIGLLIVLSSLTAVPGITHHWLNAQSPPGAADTDRSAGEAGRTKQRVDALIQQSESAEPAERIAAIKSLAEWIGTSSEAAIRINRLAGDPVKEVRAAALRERHQYAIRFGSLTAQIDTAILMITRNADPKLGWDFLRALLKSGSEDELRAVGFALASAADSRGFTNLAELRAVAREPDVANPELLDGMIQFVQRSVEKASVEAKAENPSSVAADEAAQVNDASTRDTDPFNGRDARKPRLPARRVAKGKAASQAILGARDQRAADALQDTTTIEFINTPLNKAAQQLSHAHEIPIIVNARALEEIGIASDVPVTISLRNVKLQSALRLMLRNLELTYVYIDDVMQITTNEHMRTVSVAKKYRVGDLPFAGSDIARSLQRILDAKTVAGDAKPIIEFLAGKGNGEGLLVVEANDVSQQEVESKLKWLRDQQRPARP